jgi:hypothetical protein
VLGIIRLRKRSLGKGLILTLLSIRGGWPKLPFVTPSEYVRELVRRDKERRLGTLEQELLAAVTRSKIEVPISEIRKKGLVAALRERTRRR